jgi:hypothetical protein
MDGRLEAGLEAERLVRRPLVLAPGLAGRRQDDELGQPLILAGLIAQVRAGGKDVLGHRRAIQPHRHGPGRPAGVAALRVDDDVPGALARDVQLLAGLTRQAGPRVFLDVFRNIRVGSADSCGGILSLRFIVDIA